jgi:hypothetical protein
MDDRTALGFHGSTQSAKQMTPATPVATEERKIVPIFPGSDTASKIKYNAGAAECMEEDDKDVSCSSWFWFCWVDDDDDWNKVYCGISQIATIP